MTLSSLKIKGFLILVLFVISSTTAFADSKSHGKGQGPGHGPGYQMGGHHKGGGHHAKGQGMHLFGPHWKSTLTDKQRTDIDKMHLKVLRIHVPLKAKIKALKTEIALLVTSNSPNMKTIDKKIGELLKLKKEKMHSKLAHKIEMRKILTPDQRVSFDMGVLQKALKGKHRKGH